MFRFSYQFLAFCTAIPNCYHFFFLLIEPSVRHMHLEFGNSHSIPMPGTDVESVSSSQELLMTDEEAKLFINVLNSANNDQLCILISGTMYDDQQQIKDSVRMMWKTNPSYKTMHFLFRVEDLDADANGKTSSVISSEGKDWGYLAFSVDLKSTKYGSLRANLPTNLLKFFRPTFEEVAHLTGMRMERNPPRPIQVPFNKHLKDEEGTKGISN